MSNHRFMRAPARRAGIVRPRRSGRRHTSAVALAVTPALVALALAAGPGAHASSRAPQTIVGPGFVWVPLNFRFILSYTAAFGTPPYTWNGTTCIRRGATQNVVSRITQNAVPPPVTSNVLQFFGFFAAPGIVLCAIHATDSTGLTDPRQDKLKEESAPQAGDITGTGSAMAGNLFDQLSQSYNSTVASSTSPRLFSFDATNPITGVADDSITTKQGCTAIPRPDGSSAGITALETENGTTSGHPCIDFARSTRARASDPASVTFVTLAGDAVSYATQPGSNAPPGGLSTTQLQGIYNCTITNWSQVGGRNAPIDAFIPQAGSGTRSSFLSSIGLTAPGPCVSTSATVGGAAGANDNTLQEDEGVAASLSGAAGSGVTRADVIFPYSVASYLTQRYRSARCFGKTCSTKTSGAQEGLACLPSGWQDAFSCDTHGTMELNKIDGTAPTTPFPLTKTTTTAVINPGFSPEFQGFLYDVVTTPSPPTLGIPAYLQPFFGPAGWACTSSAAQAALQNYGYVVLPAGTAPGDCGAVS